jgi:glycerol-3-phosphate dehydrogenase
MSPAIPFPRLQDHSRTEWDVIVIGGGATGAGLALDAATRGFKTLLLEQSDFGKGTSSRSTKLLHGGVRYLAQGDIGLVIEALHERGTMMRNAPHLSRNQEFVIPVYTWGDALLYTVGLTIYDILSGSLSLGKSGFISRESALKRLPLLKREGLKGGVVYHDGQFDDARFLISLIRSVIEHGGSALNYCRVTGLIKDRNGKVTGVRAEETDGAGRSDLSARIVVNASGVFADSLLQMDDPTAKPTIRPSQGVHLVLPRSFLQSDSAIMIPKTDDGRVLFAIPWYDKVVLGTTDTPLDAISLEPRALDTEIDFILRNARRYLSNPPSRKDALCVFAGLRPLAASPDNTNKTREISRRHKISISDSGFITITGGKWTTYRRMAQETLNAAMAAKLLERRPCRTHHLRMNGFDPDGIRDRLRIYGSAAAEIRRISEEPGGNSRLHDSFPYTTAEIRWICRNEMPRKLEDVLSRRTRSLILDVNASKQMAQDVARIMAEELGKDEAWIRKEVEEYSALAEGYLAK